MKDKLQKARKRKGKQAGTKQKLNRKRSEPRETRMRAALTMRKAGRKMTRIMRRTRVKVHFN